MGTLEKRAPERPVSRPRHWFEPGDLLRLLDVRPFDDRLRIEEQTLDDKYVVRAEVPGVDPDSDVQITVDDDVLRIQVERRPEQPAHTESGCRSEFRYGSFQRSLTLPSGCQASDVTASYCDGILQVEVPFFAAPAQPETIGVIRE